MSVENVNNSNTGLYVAGGALWGGSAGAATAYLTRPFLKNGAPTDSFIKKMDENLMAIATPQEKEITGELRKQVNEAINNIKSVEELRNMMIKNALGDVSDIDELKAMWEMGGAIEEGLGIRSESSAALRESILKADSIEEVEELVANAFDKEYAGKFLEDIKKSLKSDIETLNKKSVKAVFEQFWDNSKRKFVNCEEGVGKAVKDAARSVQGKYALIYGSIGAAAMSLITLLCCKAKNSDQKE